MARMGNHEGRGGVILLNRGRYIQGLKRTCGSRRRHLGLTLTFHFDARSQIPRQQAFLNCITRLRVKYCEKRIQTSYRHLSVTSPARRLRCHAI